MGSNRRRTEMASKKHRPEEAVAKLRQVDVLVSPGQTVAEAVRAIGVTEVTYYRWRREFGGLKADRVSGWRSWRRRTRGGGRRGWPRAGGGRRPEGGPGERLKELEAENARLRKAVVDLTLDKQILAEAARGNVEAPRAGAPVSSTSCTRWGCPSAAPARRSASTARRSARRPGAATTQRGAPPAALRR